jgi:hypothetical protein
MRSNKRYSNVTFTKRVDYEGGAHRPPRAPKGALVCKTCGAVYTKRRWVLGSEYRAYLARGTARPAICPACDMQAKGQVGGYLRLEGAFVNPHRAELERLLKREAGRAAEDNPLGRILRLEHDPAGALTVATTTEHLVERLGRAVHRAFGGTIDFGFSHNDKFARATWRRDEA